MVNSDLIMNVMANSIFIFLMCCVTTCGIIPCYFLEKIKWNPVVLVICIGLISLFIIGLIDEIVVKVKELRKKENIYEKLIRDLLNYDKIAYSNYLKKEFPNRYEMFFDDLYKVKKESVKLKDNFQCPDSFEYYLSSDIYFLIQEIIKYHPLEDFSSNHYSLSYNPYIYQPNMYKTIDNRFEAHNYIRDFSYIKDSQTSSDAFYQLCEKLGSGDIFDTNNIIEMLIGEGCQLEHGTKDSIKHAIKFYELRYKYEVLNNILRSKYCTIIEVSHNNPQYWVFKIEDLDSKIIEYINKSYEEIEEQYPNGTKLYLINYNLNIFWKDEIIENKSKVIELDSFYDKYNCLKLKHPIGFSEYIKYISKDYIESSHRIPIELIINQEDKIAEFERNIIQGFEERVKSALSNWEQLCGIPFYYFYHYYPQRFKDITKESENIRNLICDFKEGSSHDEVKSIVKKKLLSTFTEQDLHLMTLVCIPASTRFDNDFRYSKFSTELCDSLGMTNAFTHITIFKEKEQSHLGGTDSAAYEFDENFFKGSKIILFDDIVTRGRSMSLFKSKLENLGATVICALSIGRTFSNYYGNNRTPHPWTGTY